MFKEVERRAVNGIMMLVLLLVTLLGSTWLLILGVQQQLAAAAIVAIVGLVAALILLCGFFTVAPNQARVLTLFGNYKGSVRATGLWWTNPFMTKTAVSLRVANFETAKTKVNDSDSNPIEIGAIIVWQVVDSAEALFQVENFHDYVKVQSESALRTLASSYPYDAHQPGQRSLSHNASEISEQLATEVQARIAKAGMHVLEARIAHLAYAPEIANAMLRRQQASAIIAAREKIVEGAVTMVEMALRQIDDRSIVSLDNERKAAMVSNLLVTLCAEQPMQPVVNTGSLY